MKKTFLGLILFVVMLPLLAQAEIHIVCWTNATLNEDSTTFNASTDQKEIRLTSFKDSETVPSVFISPGYINECLPIDFVVGIHALTAQTVAKTGEISQISGVRTIVVLPGLNPIPLPPSGITSAPALSVLEPN